MRLHAAVRLTGLGPQPAPAPLLGLEAPRNPVPILSLTGSTMLGSSWLWAPHSSPSRAALAEADTEAQMTPGPWQGNTVRRHEKAPENVLAEHYHHLRRKPFYPALISYMSSGPVVAMVWEGPNVVCPSRAMIGHTDSAKAAPGTIRGDFSFHISRNAIHASDSVEGAQREIQLWFQSKELVGWADEGHRSSLYTA